MAGIVMLFILVLYIGPLVDLFRPSPEPAPFLHQHLFPQKELRPIFVDDTGPDSLFGSMPFADAVSLPSSSSPEVTSAPAEATEVAVDVSVEPRPVPSAPSNAPIQRVDESGPGLSTNAAAEIEIAHLSELREIFERRVAELQGDGDAELDALGIQYLAQLETLRVALQAEGDLNGYLAVVEESRAFSETGEFAPVEEIGSSLESLRPQYRRAEEKALLTRSQRVALLRDHYRARLEKMKREYTRQGDIPSARRVARDAQWLQTNAVVSAADFVIAEAEARILEKARDAAAGEEGVRAAAAEAPAEIVPEAVAAAGPDDRVMPRFSRDAASLLDEGVAYSRTKLSSTSRSGTGSGVQVAVTLGVSQLGDRSERKRHDFVERTNEQRLIHTLQLAVRAPEEPGGLRDTVAVAQYFASDASASIGSTTVREFSQDLIQLPPLHQDWLHVVCPPVETWGVERDVFARQYRRATRAGLRFEGVVVSVFKANGTLLYQGCSDRSLRKMGLGALPRVY